MELPQEERKMGATPRWIGCVVVDDLDLTVDRLKLLGGAVYVPPTDTNIGRIAIAADLQKATFGLAQGQKHDLSRLEIVELGVSYGTNCWRASGERRRTAERSRTRLVHHVGDLCIARAIGGRPARFATGIETEGLNAPVSRYTAAISSLSSPTERSIMLRE